MRKLTPEAPGDTRQVQKNNNNAEYVGKLWMGSERQEVNVVFDTGSSWLTINDARCDESCGNLVYNGTTSANFSEPARPRMTYKSYGSSYLEGYAANDSVCIADDPVACMTPFMYFATMYVEGMDGLHGIAGMSTGFTKDSGPVLVPALYKAGVISNPIFGWYLTGMSDESYLDIGIIHSNSIREGEEIVWIDVVNNDFWWTNYMTGIKIGDKRYSIPTAKVMTDTGTTCAYVPSSLYSALEYVVLKQVRVKGYDAQGYPYFACADIPKLPVIEFLIGGYWLQMLPDDYVVSFY